MQPIFCSIQIIQKLIFLILIKAYMRVKKNNKINSAQLKNKIIAAYMRVNRKPTKSAQHNRKTKSLRHICGSTENRQNQLSTIEKQNRCSIYAGQLRPSMALNSSSPIILMLSFFALSSFEPASSPAITSVVFAVTDDWHTPPFFSISSCA